MKLNTAKIKIAVIAFASILAISCGESSDTQSSVNEPDPVITAAKGTVALTSEQVNAVVGESFTLNITMSDFPTSEGGGVNVQFDASMLNVTDVTINSATWNFISKVDQIDNNAGLISDILFSSYNGVSGDNNIVSITFYAISSGNSQITMTGSPINPFFSAGKKVSASFIPTNVQIIAAIN